jgi:hypothetical protein
MNEILQHFESFLPALEITYLPKSLILALVSCDAKISLIHRLSLISILISDVTASSGPGVCEPPTFKDFSQLNGSRTMRAYFLTAVQNLSSRNAAEVGLTGLTSLCGSA